MVWPPWSVGELPLDPRGFPIPFWKHLVPEFPTVSRKVKLALPCIGADALGMGLKEMNWHATEIAYAWDVDPALLPCLITAHGPIGLGGSDSGIGWGGDIMAFDTATMQRVDFVVTGPRCPPFSSIGVRKAGFDKRAQVFWKVTEIIKHQGELGCYGFILEMVPGIASKFHGSTTSSYSYYENWLQYLQDFAPMFRLHTWELQTSDYLPQKRLRLYTVGIRRDHAPPHGLAPPSPIGGSTWCVGLQDLLHMGLPPIDEGMLTPQQRHNLALAQQHIASEPIGHGGCISCIAVDRDPAQAWGKHMRHDGTIATLRTQNELLWLYKADSDGRTVLSRCLHPVERFTLQGFRPEIAAFFSKGDGMRISGNAFSVPVVTHAFRKLLGCFITPQALGFPGVPPSVHRSRGPDEMAQLAYTTRLLNVERARIGILERQLELQSRRLALFDGGARVTSHIAFTGIHRGSSVWGAR